VLERIVDDWLTKAGERGYEAAFAQLLSVEGYRILQAPVHHPFEHGKDLIALTSEGQLHAFQLKGGDIDLRDMDVIQGQLFALANTAVRYPGVEPPRPPDAAFLVLSGRLTPPARDRLAALNDAARARPSAPVVAVERDELVGRFVRAHGEYLPRDLDDLNKLLRLVLADGRDRFPVSEFAGLLTTLFNPDLLVRPRDAVRALAAATIFTSYASGPWQRSGNSLGEAEAWLVLAIATMHLAENLELDDDEWLPSYEIARDTARRCINLMIDEAVNREDLIVPDIVDGTVYPARASLVCGYASAFLISELASGARREQLQLIDSVIMREKDYMGAFGESSAPLLLLAATALELFGHAADCITVMTQWAKELSEANAPKSQNAVADPYHSMEEVLLHSLGAESELDEESFAGEAYTLHISIEWLARREARVIVERLWPRVSRIHFCEFIPSRPARLLSHDDPDGQLHTWAPPTPQSWAELHDAAAVVDERAIPARLWRQLELIPYVPLIFPYRLTSDIAKAIDYMATGRCRVELIPDAGTNALPESRQ